MNKKDKIKGSLVGGAIGDALGYPVEFIGTFEGIRAKYGEHGITRLVSGKSWCFYEKSEKALVSDDTQMTLFTACGLLNGGELLSAIRDAYVEWYYTQMGRKPKNGRCWVADVAEMNARRAPGNTCMSALEAIACGEKAWNDSKGCGGVMRTAPVALYGAVKGRMTVEECVVLAGQAAELTHKHPLGWLPSALEAYVIYRLMESEKPTVEEFKGYVEEGLEMLERIWPDCGKNVEYLGRKVRRAMELGGETEQAPSVQVIESEIGGGWVGEEALAIAVYCVVRYYGDFEKTVVAAVNHGGDSDSTGAVAGNIVGAIVGYDGIPEYYKEELEMREVIERVADELFNGFTEGRGARGR